MRTKSEGGSVKVVHIMLCGPVTDGWSYQDNLLTKYHKKLGCDVTIITSQWVWGENGKLIKFEKSNYQNESNVKVIRLPIKGKDNFLRKFKCYEGVAEALGDEKPDILFIHGCQFIDMGVVVKYVKVHLGIKVYVDNHADFSNSGTNWLSKNILHKILWRRSAHMIEPYTIKFYGVLPARVDWLIDMYKLPKDKCELLVMGADDDKVVEAKKPGIREAIRGRYGIKDDDFLIMTGGKIDPWKTQTLLLMKAVAKIKNPKVKLIVFGSITPDLKEQVYEICLEDKVQYIGWINSDESYKYFGSADLVVFPGRHSVFWEQVAGMGIPMLCKYWEGTMHVDIGGNVKFLKEDSIREIEESINALVENTFSYQIMLKVAQNEGKNQFSYKEIAKRSIEI